MKTKDIIFREFAGGRISVCYTELDSLSERNVFHSHTHDACEIYVNISGDVSFVVENRIYPIVPGSIIITRPGEYHHCVYHSNALHRHFWILFSLDGMSNMLPRFYGRAAGDDNLLVLSGSNFNELTNLCRELCEQSFSPDEELYRFFKLIHLINVADISESQFFDGMPVMGKALRFIGENMLAPITVKDVAAAAYVSVSTLERYFEKNLRLSPSEYLKKRRLSHAAELLKNGTSVTDACHFSGFADCSKFIQLFRKHYGVTPLKWKKCDEFGIFLD